MAQKKKQSAQKYSIALVALSLLLITALIVVIIWGFNGNKEEEMVMSLREDMKALQVELNKIDEGWVYDEYCRGVGSTVTREDRISCQLSMENGTDNNHKENHPLYIRAIENNGNFDIVRLQEQIKSNNSLTDITVSTLSPKLLPEGVCKLADLAYSNPDKEGSYFFCTVRAQEFYFQRRD